MQRIMKRRLWLVLLLMVVWEGDLWADPGSEIWRKGREPRIQFRVDPRIELLSILFRLAGSPEYNRARVPSYARDVDSHFGPFRDHAAVRLAAELRRSRGISFDAPMSFAVHLTDVRSLGEKVPFDPLPPTLDRRWTTEGGRRFIEEARSFVKESKFSRFLDQHQAYYNRTTEQWRQRLVREVHFSWFSEFFGPRADTKFVVVLSPLNGPNNYGPHIQELEGASQFYCILGLFESDSNRNVRLEDKVSLVIHEFCHSFTNPIVDQYQEGLRDTGEKIFALVRDDMKRCNYGNWRTMMYETMVRACVIRYLRTNKGSGAADKEIERQQRLGFRWIGDFSRFLGEYESHRTTYRTFEAFFPRIVEYFNSRSDAIVNSIRSRSTEGAAAI